MGMRMLENGTLLQDRFLIEERIGTGGMGAVYSATDKKFGSRVAIKQTFYDNIELAQAFEREARLLNTLHHPVLPHVSDFFSEGDEMLLVMEYIEGEDLSEVLKRGDRPAIDDVVSWTRELLDALDYLHSQDPPIIHRDIKPNNLKRTPRGNIVLLDFGLAKETSGNTLGMRSVFGYSRRYSPLEQIEGTGTDVRSDIFSLGATIFHLLAGEPPTDVLARVSAIVAGRPDPLKLVSEINPDVPVGFAAVIRSALELNADHRFVSAAAMRIATEHALGPDGALDTNVESAVLETQLVNDSPAVPEPRPGPGHLPGPGIADINPAAESARAPRFRSYRNISWSKPIFATVVLMLIAGIAFAVFILKRSAPVETVGDSLPTAAAEAQPISGVVEPQEFVVEEKPGAAREVPISNAVADRSQFKAEKRRTGPEITKPNESVKVSPAATPPAGESRKVLNQSRPRQVARPRSDQPPIVTIESIFTGRSAEGNWRGADPWEEERMQRRRMKKLRRQGRIQFF
jgi:serine/threonine protein kinase